MLVTGRCIVSYWGVWHQLIGDVSSVKKGMSIDGAYIYYPPSTPLSPMTPMLLHINALLEVFNGLPVKLDLT